jgi:hypothetical protein
VGIPFQITVDCADADAMSEFWGRALGYVVEPPPAGFESWPAYLEANDIPVPPAGSIGAIVDPDGVGPRILFLRVPERKQAKNRWHLDLRTDHTAASRAAKVAELVSAGARELRAVDENGESWVVMTDPEGNEFCVT